MMPMHLLAIAFLLPPCPGLDFEVRPGLPLLTPPPEGAMVLFDGTDARAWTMRDTGKDCRWLLVDGELVTRPGAGSIRTRDAFLDMVLYIEFLVPAGGLPGIPQSAGNSGVYLQDRYEIQVLNSFGKLPGARECGGIYAQRAPLVNASRRAGQWQSYCLDFRAARWNETGKRTAPARLTVYHNGVLIHEDIALTGKTGAGNPEGPDPGPLVLQDHGSRVRFRNIWVIPRIPPDEIPQPDSKSGAGESIPVGSE